MQACVSIFALDVDIRSDFYQFANSLQIFINHSDVKWGPPLLVKEVKLATKTILCHLPNVVNIIISGSLQYEFLLCFYVDLFYTIGRCQLKQNTFLALLTQFLD